MIKFTIRCVGYKYVINQEKSVCQARANKNTKDETINLIKNVLQLVKSKP